MFREIYSQEVVPSQKDSMPLSPLTTLNRQRVTGYFNWTFYCDTTILYVFGIQLTLNYT